MGLIGRRVAIEVESKSLPVLIVALLLHGCSPPERNSAAENIAEALDTSIPRGWHYTAKANRIGNDKRRLAALVNEDSSTLIDNSMVLGIQYWDQQMSVFFRSVNGTFECYTTCGIRYRAGSETDMWTGQGSGDVIVLDHPDDALRTIQASSAMIVELSPNGQEQQYTFKTAGLGWPQP